VAERSFQLPDVGEGLTEAEIVTWKVAVGDTVTINQPLVDIETAKATVELPSPYEGTVVALLAEPGDVVDVGSSIITIETSGEATSPVTAAPAEAAAPAERTAVLVGYGVATEEAPTRRHRRGTAPAVPAPPAPPSAPTPSPRSTPPVRMLAKSLHVDLASIRGTGRDGLITRADVEAAASGSATTPRTASGPTRFAGIELAGWDEGPLEERIPVRSVLRAMAESMKLSAFTQPQASASLQVDATRAMDLVDSLRDRPALGGVKLSPLTILALGVCHAARLHPAINSSLDEAAGEVVVRRRIALGIAAATDRGLIVPNIKGADQLDLVGMARALDVLVATARAGTTTPSDMLGTTLTITNVGPFGIDGAVAILPPGTSAIVAVGRIAPKAWVVGGDVVARQVVELTVTFDHRVVDGALASTFLRDLGQFVEDPAAALLAG
jgi:2-oxoisovalerate dehydrogenase E2 component (dihydrolipoyl transacylase)